MPRAAAVKRTGVVNRAEISIDERDIQRLVAVLLARGPAVHVRLCTPDAISAERPRRRALTETDQALARRRVVRKRARGARRKVVRRRDVKSHANASGLTG